MLETEDMGQDFIDFVTGLAADAIPAEVKAVLRRSFADTMMVAAAGSTTEMSGIAREFASQHWLSASVAGSARIMFDGREVSPAGAAFAGAVTIDSIDAHDGNSRVKGHAGSALFPGLLAISDTCRVTDEAITGQDFMTALAIGYEVAYRAGLALHGTAADYHTSGAWTAVGLAVAVGRMLGLDGEHIRHAAGIAEYHGPRSPMMRCIDHPTMLRDGVGWGAPTGVSAAYMAEMGFTGAPALTVEGDDAAPWWGDLGERWEIMETHYKFHPVCRWAHPAIDGALGLMTEHGLAAADVERVRIDTFHNATRLAGHAPGTLDEISYGIAFPVAAAIVRGRVGLDELSPDVLKDPEIRRISRATELVDDDHLTKISVGKRWAAVTLFLRNGGELTAPPRTPRGDPDDPMDDADFAEKYRRLAHPVLDADRAEGIVDRALRFDELPDGGFQSLLDELYRPAVARRAAE
jgi:2-methylcitrate dehydratase PrpD